MQNDCECDCCVEESCVLNETPFWSKPIETTSSPTIIWNDLVCSTKESHPLDFSMLWSCSYLRQPLYCFHFAPIVWLYVTEIYIYINYIYIMLILRWYNCTSLSVRGKSEVPAHSVAFVPPELPSAFLLHPPCDPNTPQHPQKLALVPVQLNPMFFRLFQHFFKVGHVLSIWFTGMRMSSR